MKQTKGQRKKLGLFAKIYNEDSKYGGTFTEFFAYKFSIFVNRTTKAEIYQDALFSAFSIMLKKMVLEFYYSNCYNQPMDIEQFVARFQAQFEGIEHRRNMFLK